MCDWLAGSGHRPGMVVLNHGDPAARAGMAARVASLVGVPTTQPQVGDSVPAA